MSGECDECGNVICLCDEWKRQLEGAAQPVVSEREARKKFDPGKLAQPEADWRDTACENIERALAQAPALDHPCRETCSGWKQGYDKGRDIWAGVCKEKDKAYAALERECAELRANLDKAADAAIKTAEKYSALAERYVQLREALE